MTHEDILKLQTVGKDAQEERKQFILHDDEKASFEHLTSLKDARIDFVLDNGNFERLRYEESFTSLTTAGFELFTDLVFADFLVTYTPYVSRVVFQFVVPFAHQRVRSTPLSVRNASHGLSQT